MTAKVNGIRRHRHDVAYASFYVSVTARAEVRLHGLVRLHKAGLSVGPEVDGDSLSHSYTVCPRVTVPGWILTPLPKVKNAWSLVIIAGRDDEVPCPNFDWTRQFGLKLRV